ncbi:MAG TPA: crosslink repair DNA glycosylase YcaQ family protein [Candidatus Dormibacteraeota bacterium]|nr:crosslink repair DNA glycosylase YcaQ family protein [Candidatus Dormibacteraeota bacterium]
MIVTVLSAGELNVRDEYGSNGRASGQLHDGFRDDVSEIIGAQEHAAANQEPGEEVHRVMRPGVEQLRALAISRSLFRPTTLKAAVNRLGFVQADPIRSPARAQDLILRHRAKEYRAGDLERRYPSLDVEEDVLYAYGFLPHGMWDLLHPRRAETLSELEMKVLAVVRTCGTVHPKELEAHFGRDRVVNGWGGYSKATKSALERLHYCGLTRIARRENGIRIYEAAPPHTNDLSSNARLTKLVLAVATLLAPVPETTLHAITARLRRAISAVVDHRNVVRTLVKAGELERQQVDGISYLWTAARRSCEEPPRTVRFLAPFDPLVWDRRRFEHLWQWSYRFEAYTPPAKRIRGYYALPLLWGDAVIGWANVGAAEPRLSIELGFVERQPKGRDFRRELDVEIERMEAFLVPRPTRAGTGRPTATSSKRR